jgi:hypothetical protein
MPMQSHPPPLYNEQQLQELLRKDTKHDMNKRPTEYEFDRFSKLCTPLPNGCMLWSNGHGSRFWWRGERHNAQMLAYTWFVEDVPKDYEVHHLPMGTACVNPNHLILKHRTSKARKSVDVDGCCAMKKTKAGENVADEESMFRQKKLILETQGFDEDTIRVMLGVRRRRLKSDQKRGKIKSRIAQPRTVKRSILNSKDDKFNDTLVATSKPEIARKLARVQEKAVIDELCSNPVVCYAFENTLAHKLQRCYRNHDVIE